MDERNGKFTNSSITENEAARNDGPIDLEKDLSETITLKNDSHITRVPREIMDRFERWTERVLAEEPPLEGIAAEIQNKIIAGEPPARSGAEYETHTDAYALWSAMTSLVQEVKLQGRAFRELHDGLETMREMGAALEAVVGNHDRLVENLQEIAGETNAEKTARDRNIQAEAERRVRREMFRPLIDLHDHLRRGLASEREAEESGKSILKPIWIDRLLGRRKALERVAAATEAREKGYLLCLERLEDTLGAHGVMEIVCLGQPFDPLLMNVVDIEETEYTPEGTVVEVYRAGYEWNGEVLRTAQVKVARRPASVRRQNE